VADLEVRGLRCHVQRLGPGPIRVVFVHGLVLDNLSSFFFTLATPIAQDLGVLLYDLRGHGRSERPPSGYTLEELVADLDALLDGLGVNEPVHLVGNSFGGGIGLRIATKHPDRVDKLVLMGSMGVHFPITEGLDAVWGFDGTLEDMRRVMGFFAYNPALTTDELAVVRFRGATQPGFQESFSSMFPAPRQRWVESMSVAEDEIRALTNKVLIVHGREDKVIPVANSYKLLELIDNADLAVFAHCGHWSMIERTADFNRLVRDFFLGE
jgi:pimeloyl-ACP methyl ester carboxylesterase